MKRTIVVLVMLLNLWPNVFMKVHGREVNLDFFTQNEAENNMKEVELSEKEQLKKLVEETFCNAALNKLNVEQMTQGFHPDFAILIAQGNKLFRLPLVDWMQVIRDYKDNPDLLKSDIRNLEYTIDVMEITGKTAVVKTQFFRNGELVITDYLSFIKYQDGWKAVAKISNEHIPNPLHLNL